MVVYPGVIAVNHATGVANDSWIRTASKMLSEMMAKNVRQLGRIQLPCCWADAPSEVR